MSSSLQLIRSLQRPKNYFSFASATVVLIVVTALFACSSQNLETRTTSWPDGSPKEQWTVRVTNDTLEIKEGLYQYWNDDGFLSLEGYYHNGLKDGQWTKWYGTNPNIKIMEGNYSQDEMDGRWYYWMDPSHMSNMSNMSDMSDMTSSEHDDMSHTMDDSTDKKRDFVHPEPFKFAEFKMGVPDGLSLSHHHNGQVADSFMYVDGKLSGTYISYHPNGQPATVAEYKNGLRVGKQLFWDENGAVVKEIE